MGLVDEVRVVLPQLQTSLIGGRRALDVARHEDITAGRHDQGTRDEVMGIVDFRVRGGEVVAISKHGCDLHRSTCLRVSANKHVDPAVVGSPPNSTTITPRTSVARYVDDITDARNRGGRCIPYLIVSGCANLNRPCLTSVGIE